MTAIMSTAFPVRSREATVARESGRTRLRITRRGQVVVATLVAVPLIVVAALFGPAALGAAAGAAGSHNDFEHITVTSGQSLWQIAEKLAPSSDPRDVVAAIVDLNGLTDSVVVPGERLAIPQQYAAGH